MADTVAGCVGRAFNPPLQWQSVGGVDPDKPALILLHGWSMPSGVWASVVERLAVNFDVFLVDLPGYGANQSLACDDWSIFFELFRRSHAHYLNRPCYLCGWSLGGVYASLLAEAMPQLVCGLITVATAPRFVAECIAGRGVNAEQLALFRQQLDEAPDSLCRRFCGLVTRGSTSARQDLRTINTLLADTEPPSHSALAFGLALLESENLLPRWSKLDMPVLHQYGRFDELVPAAVIADVKRSCPRHEVQCFARSSHVPFVSEADAWVRSVTYFVQSAQVRNQIDRNAVANSFSQASLRYDSLADIQQSIGSHLLSYWPDKIHGTVLDLGSGTGYFIDAIDQSTRGGTVISLDIAEGMLRHSRQNSPSSCKNTLCYVRADMELLPLRAMSLSAIFSNLAVQWSTHPAALLTQMADALCEQGELVFSSLLTGSLQQLAVAWRDIDTHTHINHFETEPFMRAICESAGFVVTGWDVRDEVQYFSSVSELLRSVKGIGAHAMGSERGTGLLGKRAYRRFCAGLRAQAAADGRLPLTYRVLYARLRKTS